MSKTIKCTPSVATLQGACDAIIAGTGLPAGQITPNEFNIFVTGNNPNPSQFDGSTTPVVVTLGPGAYQVSETEDLSIQGAFSAVVAQFPEIGGIVGPILTFSGDCDPAAGTGTITAGESQTCNIENAFTLNARP